MIAEVSENYVALSWNGFTFSPTTTERVESTQFPFWQYIPVFFDELARICDGQWKHPNLQKIILHDMWDKYLNKPGYIWKHLRVRAEAAGLVINAHSAGVKDVNVKGLQALSQHLAHSVLNTLEQTQEAGKLLEQIVVLVFKGLKGVQSIKSFQSAGSQYDLLVSGDDVTWLNICKLLYLNTDKRDIVVEAKATKSALPDKQFARLCSIMDLNLTGSGLGIFFTLNGATGFPKAGSSRQRAVSDCRLRQIIFHAKTNKIIVVLDKSDIFELDKNGTLIQIITRKIRD